MLNEAQSTDKFCEYYAKWITVYKKGAIRQVTMDECSYDENGRRRLDIEIYYSFVGKVDFPE